jgi:hypothetical protein
VFVLTLVTIGSTLFWHHMGWKEGQPIHLPRWSS